MGIKAKWTTTCDGCGLVRELELELNEHNWDGTLEREEYVNANGSVSVHTYCDDSMWGPGASNGWLQVAHDEVTGKHYLFFHDEECYKNWLRKQGREAEVKEFEEAVWMA